MRITDASEGKVDFELDIQKEHTVRSYNHQMSFLPPSAHEMCRIV